MASPHFSKNDKDVIYSELENILNSKLSMGPNVKKFEEDFSKRLSIEYAVAMNSCTATLEASLNFYNVTNKEVIIPAQTFIATGMAVYHAGGRPVFAEINKRNLCIDFEDVKKKINSNTAGIIIVHMGGYISEEIFELRELCDKNGIFLIEDSAHTPGEIIKGQESGTIGHVGCFSFYPTKIITAGEGGMLVTKNEDIYKFARSYQNRGADMSLDYELYINPSRNVRMPEFAALLGRVQLKNLDSYLNKRREIAEIYRSKLSGLKLIQIILPKDLKQTACWKLPIILDKKINRDILLNKLKSENIYADKAYNPPLHLQPVIKKIYNTNKGLLPVSEDILSRSICLPCHQNMSIDDVDYVCKNLSEFIQLLK